MRSGTLDRRITIEVSTPVKSGSGERTPSWATFAEVPAEKEDLAGTELLQAQQINSKVTTRFTIRYLAGVTAKMRVIEEGTVHYDIEVPMEGPGRRESTILLCSRSAN